ncbi:MAG: hypothetical protein LLF98_10395 [Clostridium sp.]|uniref:hypothetical protein n=1 Tax=Clostridium sp. TaxID=1506 RepID=UPI0025C23AFE|nr:hypothetical protein [Clostridium sp.]MCE5221647.1 hypothetical protein [Clostridium sp.]
MGVKKISVSFKDTELENKLYDFMKQQSELKGHSAYLKELIYKDMMNKAKKE